MKDNEDTGLGLLKSSVKIDIPNTEDYESYKEMQECAIISLNAVLHKVLKCKNDLLDNNCDKEDIYRMLNSIEFDILLLNNKDNHIERF